MNGGALNAHSLSLRWNRFGLIRDDSSNSNQESQYKEFS